MEDNCYLLAHTVPPDKLTKARSRWHKQELGSNHRTINNEIENRKKSCKCFEKNGTLAGFFFTTKDLLMFLYTC
ncbi:MAG: hypothetical protein ACLU1S_00710 [Eubacterium sp.]